MLALTLLIYVGESIVVPFLASMAGAEGVAQPGRRITAEELQQAGTSAAIPLFFALIPTVLGAWLEGRRGWLAWAGARGYLLKDTSTEKLQEVIRSVHRGESQIDPAIAEKVIDEFRRLSAEGLSNKDIAARLYLSEGTVRNYVSVIMDKMHANDRTQVVIRATRRRMVKLD